jgi:hypothetical protein
VRGRRGRARRLSRDDLGKRLHYHVPGSQIDACVRTLGRLHEVQIEVEDTYGRPKNDDRLAR